MKKFKFEWANGKEVVEGKNIKDACGNIKTDPLTIITGMLVSVKELRDIDKQGKKGLTLTRWWDAEMFWKYLKRKNIRTK